MAKATVDLRHCPLCGRLFIQNHRVVCDSCALVEDQMIHTVVTWLRRNPNSSLQQVVEATGAPDQLVLRLIRDDRIVVINTMVHCERCGTLIHSGRFCAACRREMAQTMLEANPTLYKELVVQSGRFHTQFYNPANR